MSEKSRIRTGNVIVAAGFTGAALLGGLTACGSDAAPTKSAAEQEKLACASDNARPLVQAATVHSAKDNRTGKIFSCEYLLDLGIPFNAPTPLSKIDERTFDTSQFASSADFGGFLLFGTGSVHGNSASSGSTTEKDVYAMQVLGSDGAYHKLTIDSEKVELKPCAESCQPTVELDLGDSPLFNKEDTNSIWYSGAPNGIGSKYGWDRYNALLSLSYQQPRELEISNDNVSEKGSITGGPRPAGEVVGNLATKVIVEMPQELLDNPTAVATPTPAQ